MSENTYRVSENIVTEKDGHKLFILAPNNKFTYDLSENTHFEIHLTKHDNYLKSGQLSFELQWDNQKIIKKGLLELSGKPLHFPITSQKAGVLQLHIKYESNGENISTGCGFGFGLNTLKPSMEPPEDFQEFWANKKKSIEALPLDSIWVKIDKASHPHLHNYSHKAYLQHNTDGVSSHYVTVPSIGNPVQGILTMPKSAQKKTCPAILSVHGAGVIPAQPQNAIESAKKGGITFEINAHGIPNDQPEHFYQNLLNNELLGYTKRNANNRELFYFKDMFLRLVRAIAFLKSLPEWDKKRIFVRGSSQGGAQSIACAYLNPEIIGFIATVPGFCDHTAATIGRVPGWPSIAPLEDDKKPDPETIEALRYYDAANFLKYIKTEGFFSASFLDTVCKPTSIHAAYNNHAGKHHMIHQPYTAHQNIDSTIDKSFEFMWDLFQRTKP